MISCFSQQSRVSFRIPQIVVANSSISIDGIDQKSKSKTVVNRPNIPQSDCCFTLINGQKSDPSPFFNRTEAYKYLGTKITADLSWDLEV
jgi:hypothetical protein